jgi:hypothetical protein
MKSATEYLWFNTENHREFINITEKVEHLEVFLYTRRRQNKRVVCLVMMCYSFG